MAGLRVLIVDDSADDRALATRQLEREFASLAVVHAGSAAELDAALVPPPFDVVITDYWLGWTDGLRVLERVQQVDPEVPVIMYTGTGNEEVAVTAMKSGIADYVVKSPHHLVRLAASVRLAIEGRQQRAAARHARERQREAEESLVRRNAELARLNRRLSALSSRLLEVQESERRRLARELHDEVGQALTAVQIGLHTAAARRNPAGMAEALRDCRGIVDHVLAQVRDLSLDLRPSLLDDLGLGAAVRWYVERQAQRAAILVDVRVEPEDLRVRHELETTCFRVLQEALTNIVRHARASHVSVVVRQDGRVLELAVADDGCGFSVAGQLEQAVRGASLGLLGMQERVDLAGGHLAIESEPGRGTRIRARFPAEIGPPAAGVAEDR